MRTIKTELSLAIWAFASGTFAMLAVKRANAYIADGSMTDLAIAALLISASVCLFWRGIKAKQ